MAGTNDEGRKPADTIIFAACAVGFMALSSYVDPWLWQHWGPTVCAVAGLVQLAAFALAAGLITHLYHRCFRSRKGPQFKTNATISKETEASAPIVTEYSNKGGCVAGTIIIVAWIALFGFWCIGAETDNALLRQPDHPTVQFSQAVAIKGVIRYGTPLQATLDKVGADGFLGSWLIGASCMLFLYVRQRRKRKEQ